MLFYERILHLKPVLPEEITFYSYRGKLQNSILICHAKGKETEAAKKYGSAVFIIEIWGSTPEDKALHERASRIYDDWSTETDNVLKGSKWRYPSWNPMLEEAWAFIYREFDVDKRSNLIGNFGN